jgi:hypothetical protein
MTTHLISLAPFTIKEISIDGVACYFGGNRYKADKETGARILRCIESALELVVPRAVYTVSAVERITSTGTALLDTGLEIALPECCNVPGMQMLSGAIGTLGDELENRCRDLAGAGKVYDSTLLDAVGTVMLDTLSERISCAIEETCRPAGLWRAARFSPGIDGYPLELQGVLFRMVDSLPIRVRLNSSAIMQPAKSISFFLALTGNPDEGSAKYKCSVCRLAGCQFRKVPLCE